MKVYYISSTKHAVCITRATARIYSSIEQTERVAYYRSSTGQVQKASRLNKGLVNYEKQLVVDLSSLRCRRSRTIVQTQTGIALYAGLQNQGLVLEIERTFVGQVPIQFKYQQGSKTVSQMQHNMILVITSVSFDNEF